MVDIKDDVHESVLNIYRQIQVDAYSVIKLFDARTWNHFTGLSQVIYPDDFGLADDL